MSIQRFVQLVVSTVLLPCARMRSRVMRSVVSVCMYIYFYVCQQKQAVYYLLSLENLLLSVFYYFLTE